MLRPISAVLDRVFADACKQCSHLCGSSEDVQHMIRRVNASGLLTSRSVLVKLDIRNFYMDGDHSVLYQCCSDHLDSEIKHIVCNMLDLVF